MQQNSMHANTAQRRADALVEVARARAAVASSRSGSTVEDVLVVPADIAAGDYVLGEILMSS